MEINSKRVGVYVESYLRKIFDQDIYIDIFNDCYMINNTLKNNIYEFWNKSNEELLNDFNDYSFKGDYIGTIFFFLSGYWEYVNSDKKDKYERFNAKDSFAFKKGVLEEPVVEILTQRISKELNITYSKNYTNPKMFITHDIDILNMLKGFKFIRSLIGDLIKRRDISMVFKKIKAKVLMRDPHTVESLIALHRIYETKGTYFFLPGYQQKELLFVDGYSPIKERQYLKRLKEKIFASGGSIGIHYDKRHVQEMRMQEDINVLEGVFECPINAGRAHFLIFDIKRSFDIYGSAGIKLDTTCSYTDNVGFRFGTCYPFKPYNFKDNIEYDLYELPLIIMDVSLQSDMYMNLSPDEGLVRIKMLMDKVHKFNGIFTLLWHNSSFYTREWLSWEPIYEEAVKYAKSKGFEFVNADELIKMNRIAY